MWWCTAGGHANTRDGQRTSKQGAVKTYMHTYMHAYIYPYVHTSIVEVIIHVKPFGRDACSRLTWKQYSRKSWLATSRRAMTRDEQACEHGRACVYVHAVYARHYWVVCIVGSTWTVKLVSQVFLSLYATSLRSFLYLQMTEYHALHTEAMQTDCCCVAIHRRNVQYWGPL